MQIESGSQVYSLTHFEARPLMKYSWYSTQPNHPPGSVKADIETIIWAIHLNRTAICCAAGPNGALLIILSSIILNVNANARLNNTGYTGC